MQNSNELEIELDSLDAQSYRVTLRREPDEMRALIIVADPSAEDREAYGLSEIDVDYARREASLSPIGYAHEGRANRSAENVRCVK